MAKKKLSNKKLLHQKKANERKVTGIKKTDSAITPMNFISQEQFISEATKLLQKVKQSDNPTNIATFPAQLYPERKALARLLQGYILADANLKATDQLTNLTDYQNQNILVRGLVVDFIPGTSDEEGRLVIQAPTIIAHNKDGQTSWNYLTEPLALAPSYQLALKDILSASDNVRVSIGDYIILDTLVTTKETLSQIAIVDSGLIITTKHGFNTLDSISSVFPRKKDFLFEFTDLPNDPGQWGLVLNNEGLSYWSPLASRSEQVDPKHLAEFNN